MDVPAQDGLKQSVKDKPTKQAHTERAAAKTQVGIEKQQMLYRVITKDKNPMAQSGSRVAVKQILWKNFLSQPLSLLKR